LRQHRNIQLCRRCAAQAPPISGFGPDDAGDGKSRLKANGTRSRRSTFSIGSGFFKVVSPSYFSTLGIRIVKGRALSDRDTRSSPPVLIINEQFARRYFQNEDSIGQHILIQEIVPGKTVLGSEISWEVVGMIGDEKIGGPADDQSAGVYVSHEQSPVYGMVLSVRASVDPLRLQKAIRAAIHSVNKDQAIIDVRTVDQIRDLAMAGRRLQSVLLSVFGAVALVLAGLGVYGVISYSVAQRTREMGIRAALGASKPSLLRLVFQRAAWLTAVGLALGMAGASALTGLMSNLLYNVSPRDPATMTAVAFTLAAVAGLASYVPARRATKIDPLQEHMPGLLASNHVPGAVVSYIKNGEVAWTKAFGVANLQTGTPMRPNMVFNHGSNGKVMTAST
jgi:putative ABC transport system permease protein